MPQLVLRLGLTVWVIGDVDEAAVGGRSIDEVRNCCTLAVGGG